MDVSMQQNWEPLEPLIKIQQYMKSYFKNLLLDEGKPFLRQSKKYIFKKSLFLIVQP